MTSMSPSAVSSSCVPCGGARIHLSWLCSSLVGCVPIQCGHATRNMSEQVSCQTNNKICDTPAECQGWRRYNASSAGGPASTCSRSKPDRPMIHSLFEVPRLFQVPSSCNILHHVLPPFANPAASTQSHRAQLRDSPSHRRAPPWHCNQRWCFLGLPSNPATRRHCSPACQPPWRPAPSPSCILTIATS